MEYAAYTNKSIVDIFSHSHCHSVCVFCFFFAIPQLTTFNYRLVLLNFVANYSKILMFEVKNTKSKFNFDREKTSKRGNDKWSAKKAAIH